MCLLARSIFNLASCSSMPGLYSVSAAAYTASMKSCTEMHEGPEAFDRFHQAMKTIVSAPKSAVMETPKKAKRKKPADRKG